MFFVVYMRNFAASPSLVPHLSGFEPAPISVQKVFVEMSALRELELNYHILFVHVRPVETKNVAGNVVNPFRSPVAFRGQFARG